MEQVFALEINFSAAEFLGEPLGKVERGGATAKFLEVIFKLALKRRVLLRAQVFVLQLLQRLHQRFGHETSAVGTEMAMGIWNLGAGILAHKTAVNLA